MMAPDATVGGRLAGFIRGVLIVQAIAIACYVFWYYLAGSGGGMAQMLPFALSLPVFVLSPILVLVGFGRFYKVLSKQLIALRFQVHQPRSKFLLVFSQVVFSQHFIDEPGDWSIGSSRSGSGRQDT